MPYTEAQKRATYKWREQNRERVYELNKPLQQRYYLENKEKCSIESKLRYQYKKECKRMRDILLEPLKRVNVIYSLDDPRLNI